MIFLFLKQGEIGGTDFLLDRAGEWFAKKDNKSIKACKKVDLSIKYDVVIVPSSEIFTFLKYAIKGMKYEKLMIWNMGHGAFSAGFLSRNCWNSWLSKIVKPLFGLFLKRLLNHNAVIFTDSVGCNYDFYNLYNRCYESVDDLIVPIAIKKSIDFFSESSFSEELGLNCVWLGRVSADFKVAPLLDVIKILNSTSEINVDNFYIIGSGDGLEYLKSSVEVLKPSFNITYIDFISVEEIFKFLKVNGVNIGFAMGTSALEIAKNGVPTIILPAYSMNEKKVENKYRFVQQSLGFSLGEFFLHGNYPSQPMVDLLDLIIGMNKEGRYNYGVESRKYTEYFYEDSVFEILNEKILGAKKYRLSLIDYSIFAFLLLKKKLKELIVRGRVK